MHFSEDSKEVKILCPLCMPTLEEKYFNNHMKRMNCSVDTSLSLSPGIPVIIIGDHEQVVMVTGIHI